MIVKQIKHYSATEKSLSYESILEHYNVFKMRQGALTDHYHIVYILVTNRPLSNGDKVHTHEGITVKFLLLVLTSNQSLQ
jgi:hypothetical protein